MGDSNPAGGRLSRARMLALAVAVLAIAATLAACGGGGDSSASGESAGGSETSSSSTGSGSKELVMFVPTSENTYVAGWIKGAKEEAKALGLTPKIIENNFDQTEEDTQVQQQLASGDEPAGYMWWPIDAQAGAASLSRLAATGAPVVQANEEPLAETLQFVTAYAGVDNKLNGEVAGENILKARAALEASGAKLHSPKGNLVYIGFPAGYQAGIDREKATKEAMGSEAPDYIRTENSEFEAEAGYQTMSQIYPAVKSQGVDIVFVGDDGQAAGVLKALKEAGLEPGKDVMVVSGTCKTNAALEKSGEVFATGIQPPVFEGKISVSTLGRLAENGGSTSGEEFLAPSDPNAEPSLSGDPAKYNYMPNPAFVGKGSPAADATAVAGTKLWGQPMEELCAN